MKLVEVTPKHKQEIENKLVDVIIRSLEVNKLKETDLPAIANFILERIDLATDHDKMIGFLKELSDKWPVFDQVEEIERGEVKDKVEDKVAVDVLTLAKNGKIEDAIRMAKTMTEEKSGN